MGASNRTEMLRLRGVLLTILRLLGLRARLLSILAVYKRRFTPTKHHKTHKRFRAEGVVKCWGAHCVLFGWGSISGKRL